MASNPLGIHKDLAGQYSRELFYNRLLYMIDEVQRSANSSWSRTTGIMYNSNAGEKVEIPGMSWREVLDMASRRGSNATIKRPETKIIPEYVKLAEVMKGPGKLPLNHQVIRSIHDIVRDATEIQMGHRVSADAIFPKLHANMPINLNSSLNNLITTEEVTPSQIRNQMLSDSIAKNMANIQSFAIDNNMLQFSHGLQDILDEVINPDNMNHFIRYDLYEKGSDVGNLSARRLGDDFFEEKIYDQMNEALFHYTEGGSGEMKYDVRITSEELDFRNILQERGLSNEDFRFLSPKLAETYTDGDINRILSNADASGAEPRREFRNLVVDLRDGITRYETNINEDRRTIRSVKNILEEATSSGTSIANLLKENARYKDSSLTKYVVNHMNESGNTSDNYARHMMRLFLQSSEQMNAAPVYMASHVVTSSTDMISKIDSIISDSYDPESKSFAQYHRFRNFKSGYYTMYGLMNEARSYANAEESLYVGNRDTNKINGFDADEYNNMYKESIRVARMEEENKRAYDRHAEAIKEFEAEGKSRPLQPMNRFRNAFAVALLEENADMVEQEEMSIRKMIETSQKNIIESETEIPRLQEQQRAAMERVRQQSRVMGEIDTIMRHFESIDKKAAESDLPFYRDWIQAKEELTARDAVVKEIGERIRFHENTISNNGWREGMSDWTTSEGLNNLKEILADEKTTITYLTEKELNPRNRDKWHQAVNDQQRLRLQGSQVAYVPTAIDGNYVQVKKDVELAKNATIRLDITDPEQLDRIINRINERAELSKVDHEVIREIDDRVVHNAFVNIRYKQEMVSEDLKAKNAYVFDKIREAEAKIQESGLMEYGVKEVNIPAQDLNNVYNHFRKNLDELDSEGIKKRMALPKFLIQMAESHAPWMLNNTDELVSSAELALREVTDELAKTNTTLDLTDEALETQWSKYAKVDSFGQMHEDVKPQFEMYKKALQGKGLNERLDDHLFMRVLAQMVQNHFEFNPTNDSMSNFLKEAQLTLESFSDRDVNNPRDVHRLLRNKGVKELFKEHGYYAQALQLSPEQIGEVLNGHGYATINEVQFDSLGEYFDEQNMNPYLEKVSENEVHGNYYDHDRIQASIHDEYRLDPDEYHDLHMTGNPEKDYLMKEMQESRSGDDILRESLISYENLRKEAVIEKLNKGLSVPGVQDLEFMLDIAKETGQDSISGIVRGQEATIFRGSQGEILAELKEDNIIVGMTDTEVGHVERIHMNDSAPQTLYGESIIKQDIGEGGSPTRYQLNSYETMQGSGKYTIPTNPSVSIGAMQDFLRGKGTMTYLDIETTGLEGSTIDSKYIQPIEVFMQKVQWDPEGNQLLTNADGDYVIRHAGRETTREMQILNSLNDDVKGFMQDIIANEDFNVHVQTEDGMKAINVLDYERTPGAYDSMISAADDAPRIRTELIQKQDKMWFLRNIAKYAFPGDDLSPEQVTRYQQYAGNSILPARADTGGFIQQLKADAQLASDLLDKVGVAGGPKYSDVQVGTTPQGMVKHVSRFVGKSPVVGQNVAKADWSKFMKIAQTDLDNATAEFETNKKSLMNKLDSTLTNEVKTVVDRFDKYLQSNKDLSKRNREALSQLSLGLANGDTETNATSMDEFRKELSSMRGERNKRALRMFDKVYEQFQKDPHMVDALVPYSRMNQLQEVKGQLSRGESVGFLDKALTNRFADETAAVNESLGKLTAAQKLVEGLPNPEIVEQMYLSQLVNPNLSGNSAEAQFAQMGIDVTSESGTGLHLARTDVKNNLKLIEAYGQELSGNTGFTEFDNTPIQQGDFLELHKQVDRNMPIGVYQVDGVDGKQMQVSHIAPDGTRTQHTVHGASQADLSRKVGTHFTFIGESNADEPVQQTMNRLVEDHARRQMARASDSAFAFDLYQGEMQQLTESGELTHAPLTRMRERYESVKADTIANMQQRELDPKTPMNEIDSVMARVAAQNAELFEGNALTDLLDKTASPTKQAAFDLTKQWMESAEGQKRQSFLNEVRALEDTGAIDKRTSRSLIKEWNEAIKKKGFELGAKHTVFNKSNLGTLDNRFGSLEGTDFVVGRSSPGSVAGSLWRLAERAKDFDDPNLDEVKAKEAAFNQKVLPFLENQGIIEKFDPKSPPRMNSVVQKIMNNSNLAPYEEYDFMKSAELSNDEGFMKFMDDKSNEILQPIRDNLTKVQEAKINVYNEMRDELLNAEGGSMYHPALKLQPNLQDIEIDTMNFSRHGGLGDYSANELARIMDSLDESKDVDTRNTVVGELFQQATNGRQVDIDDVIRAGDSNQLRAMEALNWVTNTDGIYTPNTDIASHYFGAPGRFAGTRLGMMPLDQLDAIAGETSGRYTKGNGYTTIKNKIEGWKEDGYEGRYPTAPNKTLPREQLKQSNAATKAEGETRRNKPSGSPDGSANESLDNVNRYIREIVEPDTSYLHSNVISDTLTKVKTNAVNWATSMSDMGMGKAAKWIGGLGIAAFALHQFANASSPIKLERKEQGHGVEGATGQQNDGISYGDEGSSPSSPKPSTGGKTYADAGSGGQAPGYRVKVRGEAGSDFDTNQLNKQMNEQMGNVNLNMTDNRTSLDRSWLENQFSSYIDRGHVE